MNIEVAVQVKQIYKSSSSNGAYALLLEEIGNKQRQIPIIIGEKEANSIYSIFNNIPSPRPLTHDIMVSSLHFLEANISKVFIYKVKEGIYYSYLYLNKEDQYTRIDSRTSDAVALALRMKTPIFIAEEILESENIEVILKEKTKTLFNEISKEELEAKLKEAISEENYELASILRDQIAKLD